MTPEQEKAIDKIKKLLRLGRGTNHAGERDTALAKAAEVAAAAGLDISGIDAGDGDIKMAREDVALARRSHARILAHNILLHHFGVFVVGGRGCLVYFGPAVNIEIAKHVEIYLLREAAREWAGYKDSNRLRKRGLGARRKVWEHGFFGSVSQALDAHPLRNDAEALRLAVEKYAFSVMRIRTVKFAAPRSGNADDLLAGINAGDNVTLARPVGAAAQARQIGTEANPVDKLPRETV
jgi:hypothetical protein